jgi:hypothetical protein
MTPQILIILFSTLLPAAAVAMILHKGGKTIGYCVFGALAVYATSLAILIVLFQLHAYWPNMPFQAFLLLMPIAIAGLFVWQLKDRGPNRPR